MQKSFYSTIFLVFFAFVCAAFSSCVSKGKYDSLNASFEQIKARNGALSHENKRLAAEIQSLENKSKYVNSVADNYEKRVKVLEKYINSSQKNQNKIIIETAAAKQSLQDKLNAKEIELSVLKEENIRLLSLIEPAQNKKSRSAKSEGAPE